MKRVLNIFLKYWVIIVFYTVLKSYYVIVCYVHRGLVYFSSTAISRVLLYTTDLAHEEIAQMGK